jgi:serine/threonine protein kinase
MTHAQQLLPSADQVLSVSLLVMQLSVFRTLLDIASGMQYLHSLGLIHGEPLDDGEPINHGASAWCSFLTEEDLPEGYKSLNLWLAWTVGDLKPANVLLKSTVTDSRGFNVK